MRWVAVVAALVAAAAAVAALAGTRGTRPDPQAQAILDGCGREVTGLFKKELPTWVYVGDRDAPASGPPPAAQRVRGVVDSPEPAWYAVHPTPVDDPVTHDSYDVIVNVKPDPAYEFLLGGDPPARTGNFGAGEGEATGRLHTEREEVGFPPFAWPEKGDRVELLGSWIWDCGHWQPGGERTELHPVRAAWVERALSPRSPYGEAEGDLFVSTDATPAGKSAECAHRTKGDRAAFKACLGAQPDWLDVNGSYRFTLPAPPQQLRGAKLRARVVDAGSTRGAPAVRVEVGKAGATVSVTVAEPVGKRVVIAKQIFLGWRPMREGDLPEHLRVRFEQVHVRRSMDPGCPATQPDCPSPDTTRKGQLTTPPGEFSFYSDVAGIWTPWRPRAIRAGDGQTVRVSETVDAYVRRDRPWRVLVFARECDNGRLSASSIERPPFPCPRSDEFLDLVGDDAAGTVVDEYRSPAAALGRHSSDARLEESSCPPINRRGCYQVTYSVTRVDDAAKRAAATR